VRETVVGIAATVPREGKQKSFAQRTRRQSTEASEKRNPRTQPGIAVKHEKSCADKLDRKDGKRRPAPEEVERARGVGQKNV
jgi:hypothetical protein